jgi:mitochondrial fission protein ELM1
MKRLVSVLILALSVSVWAQTPSNTCRVAWSIGSGAHGHGQAISCQSARAWQYHALCPGEVRRVEHRTLFFFWRRERANKTVRESLATRMYTETGMYWRDQEKKP